MKDKEEYIIIPPLGQTNLQAAKHFADVTGRPFEIGFVEVDIKPKPKKKRKK